MLTVLESYRRGRGLIRGAAVAAICVTSLALGLAATAIAIPWEANGAEPSAGEQLGLEQRETQAGGSSQLVQTVATSPGGDELFGFSSDAGLLSGECQSLVGRGYLGFHRAGGPLRLLSRLPAFATPPVIGGGREAVVVFKLNCKQRSILPFYGSLERLRLLTGALGGRPTTTTVLSSTAEQSLTTIAASPSGDLAVAWLAPHGRIGIGLPEPRDLLHISIGHISGRMGRPILLGEHDRIPRVREGFFTHVRLAWTAHHELLVAYTVNKLAMLQTWRPGRGFDRPQVLGPVNPGGNIDLSIAVGPAGRAAVAWGTQQDVGEPRSPWKVYATVRTASTARFGVAHLLNGDTARAVNEGIPDVSAQVDADGFTTVAWSSQQGDGAPVSAVTIDSGGRFQAVQELASECANLALADAPGGGTVLQWQVPEGEGRFSLDQATRLPGGDSFAPAQASTSRLGVIDGAQLIDSATGG